MVRYLLIGLACLLSAFGSAAEAERPAPPTPPPGKVFIIPIREDIDTPLVFLVRRGVKAAIDARADWILLDMDTHGGRVDKTEEIIEILGQFRGKTLTFVNRRAFSAGAFISFATQQIFMAPEGVIGAAAPIVMAPGGGVQSLPETVEAKMVSALAAMVRASAEKNGHNVDVAEAMVRRTKELVIDGEVLNKPGELLTLTSKVAERRYGTPPKSLLSSGTFQTIDDLLTALGAGKAERVIITPTGLEQLATWLSSQWLSSILLIIGIAGVYIEFKTPGFGLPGVVGIVAFALYFLGGYAAGLSGAGWILAFLVGLALLLVELFLVPGSVVIGVGGVLIMLTSLVMALADAYPNPGKWIPAFPGQDAFLLPLQSLVWAFVGSIGVILVLSKLLPRTRLYHAMISHGVSGGADEKARTQDRDGLLGCEGLALSPLRPSGKAQFGDRILDVVTQGDLVEKGTKVKILSFGATGAIVRAVEQSAR